VENSVVTDVLLPGALGLIMFGLGLSLTAADFRRVLVMPKAVLVGLFAQTVVLTALCALICIVFGLPPELAIGMMLLAAAPGGASANIFSHLAHGDLALNITLTAINSVLALVTLPALVSLSFAYFGGEGHSVPPPLGKVIEVTFVVLLPVMLGMFARAKALGWATKAEKWVRGFSVVVLTAFSAMALWKNSEVLLDHAPVIGAACLVFNIVSMLLGYSLPRLVGLTSSQAVAISMEVGIHNAALAMFIAINVLGDGVYAIPAAVYSFVMFVTASVVTLGISWKRFAERRK
jgi:BASS family bile acid:Na+ symporter